MFDKTLSSDVTQEEAVGLLRKVDEKTSLFKGQQNAGKSNCDGKSKCGALI